MAASAGSRSPPEPRARHLRRRWSTVSRETWEVAPGPAARRAPGEGPRLRSPLERLAIAADDGTPPRRDRRSAAIVGSGTWDRRRPPMDPAWFGRSMGSFSPTVSSARSADDSDVNPSRSPRRCARSDGSWDGRRPRRPGDGSASDGRRAWRRVQVISDDGHDARPSRPSTGRSRPGPSCATRGDRRGRFDPSVRTPDRRRRRRTGRGSVTRRDACSPPGRRRPRTMIEMRTCRDPRAAR